MKFRYDFATPYAIDANTHQDAPRENQNIILAMEEEKKEEKNNGSPIYHRTRSNSSMGMGGLGASASRSAIPTAGYNSTAS